MSNLKERCERTVEQMEDLLDMAIKNCADKESYKGYDAKDFVLMQTVLAFFDKTFDRLKEYGEAFDKNSETLERIEKRLVKIEEKLKD